jgi:hypothetical protein
VQFIGVFVLVLLLALVDFFNLWPEPPQLKPQQTIREMCTSSGRPDWCNEYYRDLAYGRKQSAENWKGMKP